MNVRILVADASHVGYAPRICELMYVSALERGTGIAKRSPEYIAEKMKTNKAIIALCGDRVVGFSYIESWSHKAFVANSGLIVDHEFRHLGLGAKIKRRIFALSRERYPEAKIFAITTGAAVMKINSRLGYRPVPFSELTHDDEFWKGCEGCRNYDILMRNEKKMCLCTGMLYDPAEHKSARKPAKPDSPDSPAKQAKPDSSAKQRKPATRASQATQPDSAPKPDSVLKPVPSSTHHQKQPIL